jgi:Flp pilus assembly pilin Flp
LRNNKFGMTTVTRLIKDEQGIQHAEESLLLSLIGAALTTVVGGLGTSITALYATSVATVTAAVSA